MPPNEKGGRPSEPPSSRRLPGRKERLLSGLKATLEANKRFSQSREPAGRAEISMTEREPPYGDQQPVRPIGVWAERRAILLWLFVGGLFVVPVVGMVISWMRSSPELFSPQYWARETLAGAGYALLTLFPAYLASVAYFQARDHSSSQDWRRVAAMVLITAFGLALFWSHQYVRAVTFLTVLLGVPAAIGVWDWQRAKGS